MKKIDWCKEQRDGIKIVEPNDNLSESHLSEALSTLDNLNIVKDKWSVIMGYYSCYHALNSILIKAGIKCEIHDCTIKLLDLIDEFDSADQEFLQKLKEERINVQYYLKDKRLDNIDRLKEFIVKCRKVREGIDIHEFRKKLEN